VIWSREVGAYGILFPLFEDEWFISSTSLAILYFIKMALESFQDCSLGLTHILFATCFTSNAVDQIGYCGV